jgi:arylsulfatase A-like enzyme
MATSAEILGVQIPPGAGEDSCSILPLLLGQPANYHPARPVEIHAGVNGMAVRQGRWKLVESRVKRVNPARPDALSGLYDLQTDPSETSNVIAQHPEIATALKSQLGKFTGRQAQPLQTAKPNILLMVADDLGYGDVSANGCQDFQTPQLDALAASGIRFAAGYVTAPLCSPSRAALLTGRHQCRFLPYGGNPPGPTAGLPLEVHTLAEHLKGAGYRTAALGKWHLGEAEQLHPLSRGFDEFFGFLSGMHDYFKTDDPRWGMILRGRQRDELRQYLTFALAEEACAFVRRDEPEPFFLYLAFNAPHLPLQAPEEYLAKTAHLADPKRRINAAMVMALDDAVGRVLAALRANGRLENTLVFFLSDNGAALLKGSAANGGSNAPLRGSKTQLWEGGIRVPFFAAWKGHIPPGGVTHEPVSSLDVVPTALTAAGVRVLPEWNLDGLNLLPWLTGDSAAPKRGPLYWKFGLNQTAIRDGDMKLVHMGKEGGLFNVRQDISESRDRTSARPILAKQLEEAWRAWEKGNIEIRPMAGKEAEH